ncbi:hypothetical protein CQA53_11825, partial [Helicobacter didelphidarum]
TRSGIRSAIITLPPNAMREYERPKEKVYIEAYEAGVEDSNKASRIMASRVREGETLAQKYAQGLALYNKAIKSLEFAYKQGGDYKAGIKLAEIYIGEDTTYNYQSAIIQNIGKDDFKEWGPIAKPIIKEHSKKAIDILLELIEKYNLPDAYYGMYYYHYIKKKEDEYFNFMFDDIAIIKTPEYWFDLALKNGSYDAIKSYTNSLSRE